MVMSVTSYYHVSNETRLLQERGVTKNCVVVIYGHPHDCAFQNYFDKLMTITRIDYLFLPVTDTLRNLF